MKALISLAVCERILRQSGADRVSDKARQQLSVVLLDYANDLSERAIRLAKHAGRKTIKSSDIKLANKPMEDDKDDKT